MINKAKVRRILRSVFKDPSIKAVRFEKDGYTYTGNTKKTPCNVPINEIKTMNFLGRGKLVGKDFVRFYRKKIKASK